MTATTPDDTGASISLADGMSLADGALDTLGCVFQTMARESFPLEPDNDPQDFAARCLEVARHVENGSAAPSICIEAATSLRNWGAVRRFYVDRRRSETSFVSSRLQDYRGIIEQFVIGLKQIAVQNGATKKLVSEGLGSIEAAINGGKLDDIKKALALVVNDVGFAFSEQEIQHQQQIYELNQRIDVLREDLVAAQEEMQLDSLTEICNRGAFSAALQRHVNTYFLLRQPVSVIMIDVDNFKAINDTFGHPAGDSVLQAIAGHLSRIFVRRNDVVARYGGDEFAIILPDSDIKGLASTLQRMLKVIRSIKIETADDAVTAKPEIVVSCSAGCAEICETDTVESLVNRADKALYEAKQAGRNRYRSA